MTDLYELAKTLFINTQNKQIQKGLNTYGKPLDPFEWTPDQLLQHAIDETVDDLHYKVALAQLAKAAFVRIADLEAVLKEIAEETGTPYADLAQKTLDRSLERYQKTFFTDVVKKPLSPSSEDCDHKYRFLPSETKDPLRAEWKCEYCEKVVADSIKK